MKIKHLYSIAEERYKAEKSHRLLLETIQYAVGGDTLTKQTMHAGLKRKLPLDLVWGWATPEVFYFIENRRQKEKTIISKTDIFGHKCPLGTSGNPGRDTAYGGVGQGRLHYRRDDKR